MHLIQHWPLIMVKCRSTLYLESPQSHTSFYNIHSVFTLAALLNLYQVWRYVTAYRQSSYSSLSKAPEICTNGTHTAQKMLHKINL